MMTKDLERSTLDAIEKIAQDANRLFLAYSGGVDSSVLVHLAARLGVNSKFTLLHVNHQLSVNADHWQAHCEQNASKLEMNIIVRRLCVLGSSSALEENARWARYKIFSDSANQTGDCVLLAHHLDDQAETVLFRLCRGSGVKGLSGIPYTRQLNSNANLFRPLLSWSKDDILAYAQKYHLHWVEDESNTHTRFTRNFLRSDVLPALKSQWPNISTRLARTANNMSESNDLLEDLGRIDLKSCERTSERCGESVVLERFKQLPKRRQDNLLWHWARACNIPRPEKHLLAQLDQLLYAREDSQPILSWKGAELRRYNLKLYLLPALPSPIKKAVEFFVPSSLTFPNGFLIQTISAEHGLHVGRYEIHFRQGGERAHPVQREHSQKLKKLLQEFQLEPWLRDHIPLIYKNDELAAVGDLWIEKAFFHSSPGPENFHLSWRYIV